MDAVKLGCGCGIAALALGVQLANLPGDQRRQMTAIVGRVLGSQADATLAPARPAPLGAGAAERTSPPPPSPGQTETLSPDRGGQYQTDVEVFGQRLHALIDTGATLVTLTYDDADRIGLRPMPSDFRVKTWTANGTTMVAPVTIAEMRLGQIIVRDVAAWVSPRGASSHTLLGMSFLGKLGGLHLDGRRLVLQQ